MMHTRLTMRGATLRRVLTGMFALTVAGTLWHRARAISIMPACPV